MTMEQLHFMVESPANFVRLACTILFEKRKAMAEWAATWHDVFDCANGEQLFLQFMEELFPDGCTIGEKELNRITDRAVRYLQTETRCLDLKAGHDKSRFTYWCPLFLNTKSMDASSLGMRKPLLKSLPHSSGSQSQVTVWTL